MMECEQQAQHWLAANGAEIRELELTLTLN